jgi:putative oxidoreductase
LKRAGSGLPLSSSTRRGFDRDSLIERCRQAGPAGPTDRRRTMGTFGAERVRDEAVLIARILLIVLYVVFGWGKLTDYTGTVAYMTQTGAPAPWAAAIVAIVVEFFVALAVAVGAWTRPLALLLALYTLGTALIGHPFWTMQGAARYGTAINFYKNVSIIGGFLLLYVTGPGRYSVDAAFGRYAAPPSR